MNDKYDKAKILALMDVEYDFWQRTLAQMSAEQMRVENVQGFWSTKDTVAHLTAWMERAMVWIETVQRGEPPVIPEAGYTWDEVDKLNDARTLADRAKSLDAVLEEFAQTYAKLRAFTASLSETDLIDSTYDGKFWEPTWTVIAYNSFFHFRDHLTPIRQWLSQQAKG
jgi:hypothetical protein